MYYNPKCLVLDSDGATRAYLEIPIHFLESIGLTNDSLVHLHIDNDRNALVLTALEDTEYKEF